MSMVDETNFDGEREEGVGEQTDCKTDCNETDCNGLFKELFDKRAAVRVKGAAVRAVGHCQKKDIEKDVEKKR